MNAGPDNIRWSSEQWTVEVSDGALSSDGAPTTMIENVSFRRGTKGKPTIAR